MPSATIAQRELRNNISEVLRRAAEGTEFTITVRGHPVARLLPAYAPPQRKPEIDRESFRAILAQTPVDDGFAGDLAQTREREPDAVDPWERA